MMATATFAAGCFWGVEAAFRELPGVTKTEVGYTGGHAQDPTYTLVCTDTTGHAEAVKVTYDQNTVKYEDLLAIFWKTHDPTQRNRQGPDVGSQYRSAVFYHTKAQKSAAEKSKKTEAARLGKEIATEIVEAGPFYRAEEYHQQYAKKHPWYSCHIRL